MIDLIWLLMHLMWLAAFAVGVFGAWRIYLMINGIASDRSKK